MIIIKETANIKCWKNVEKLNTYAWLYEIQIGANSIVFLKKLKIQLCCDAVIPLLSIYPRDFKGGSTKDICTLIYIVVLFKKPTKDGSNPNVHRLMNEKNRAYTYNGLIFRLEIKKIFSHGQTFRTFLKVKHTSHKEADTVDYT